MNYIRIDYKGNMQLIREEKFLDFISDDKGVVLIVTGQFERSKVLYADLEKHLQATMTNRRELYLEKEHSKYLVRSQFDWPSYMGLQLTSAYIHRDASIDFMLKILSKCRYVPR